jgi:YD repeat-containing protein
VVELAPSGSDLVYATPIDTGGINEPGNPALGPDGYLYTIGGFGDIAVVGPLAPPAFIPQSRFDDVVAPLPGTDVIPDEVSPAGVRYADGAVLVTAADFPAGGFGMQWGQTRSWSNNPGYSYSDGYGNGWVVSQLPQLIAAWSTPWPQTTIQTLVVVSDGTTARYFDLAYNGTYYPQDPTSGSLPSGSLYDAAIVYDATNGQYVLTDSGGAQLRFNDFATSRPAANRGAFYSYTGTDGVITRVTSTTTDGRAAEVQRAVSVGTTSVVDSYVYNYVGGLLQGVTWRRQTGTGSFQPIRTVVYAYYDSGQPYGNVGDLETATVSDGTGNVLGTSYYRYYTPADSTDASGAVVGYAGGLKYVFGPAAYARLTAAIGDAAAASDAQVAAYVDRSFQYDELHRATAAVVAGAGGAATNGLGTYRYQYARQPSWWQFPYGTEYWVGTAATQSWMYKTVETRPDGTVDTVFCNAAGEVMVSAVSDPVSGVSNDTYYQYAVGSDQGSLEGQLLLVAYPSAVLGYDPTDPQLMHLVFDPSAGGVSGLWLAQLVRRWQGLVEVYLPYSDRGPAYFGTDTTPGDSPRRLHEHWFQSGYIGYGGSILNWAVVPTGGVQNDLTQYTYYRHSVNGRTTSLIAQVSENGQLTNYPYNWSASSLEPVSTTETDPTISPAQNGPGTPDTTATVFDVFGRPIWVKDAKGYLHYTAYDPATGAVVETIDDVKTALLIPDEAASLPQGWTTPADGGTHRKTVYEVDALGRVTKKTNPDGIITYTVYNDANHEVRTYPGWHTDPNVNNGLGGPTGPTQVTRDDWARGYTETLTTSNNPAVSGGRPTGMEPITFFQTMSRSLVNAAGQVIDQDDYFQLWIYSTTPSISWGGSPLYYRTTIDYDAAGRVNRVKDRTGTITRTVYDGFGRRTSTWVGTNDTVTGGWSPAHPGNLVKLSDMVYDGGSPGDGNLTQMTEYPGDGTAARVTRNAYDWADRLVATKDGVQANENDGTHRPIVYYRYDSLDRLIETDQYDGDTVSIYLDANSDGVPDPPSPDRLRAETTTEYDDQDRPYRTHTFSVDPTTGNVSSTSLDTRTYYDQLGQVIATAAPGGLWTKTSYDGVGRVKATFTTDGGGGTSWAAAGTVDRDVVLEQTNYSYGGSVNSPDTTVTRQRDHDASAGPGDLAEDGAPASRAYYSATYYDTGGRPVGDADWGTYGGLPWSAPPTVPNRSNTILVTSYGYDAAGRENLVTDPRGETTTKQFDALDRMTYQQDPQGQVTWTSYTDTGYEDTKAFFTQDSNYSNWQKTQYFYGSGPTSNQVMEVWHPDPTNGDPSPFYEELYGYNNLGQVTTFTDQNGTSHAYKYDALGRPTTDTVTSLGSRVDGTVMRRATAYDSHGNAYQFTSYDAPTGGSVVNQVQQQFIGLGQLTAEDQSHAGPITTSTPEVRYGYLAMFNGANNSRPTDMTYPDGSVLFYDYGPSGLLNDRISRLAGLTQSGQTLESYAYLGLGTVVERAHPAVGLTQSLIGASPGDGGDQYVGLDRFGCVAEQRWTLNGSSVEDLKYGHDADGNVTYRQNVVNPALSEVYSYNGLNELTSFDRGTLNSTRDCQRAPKHHHRGALQTQPF